MYKINICNRLAYGLAYVGKGNEEYAKKVTPVLVSLLEDKIANVRISTLVAFSLLKNKDDAVKESLNKVINNDKEDDDVKEIANIAYNKLFC